MEGRNNPQERISTTNARHRTGTQCSMTCQGQCPGLCQSTYKLIRQALQPEGRQKPWSAGHVQGADPAELRAVNHVQRAEQPEPQKAMSIQPGCCSGTSPQVTRQAAQKCSSEHRASALLQQQRGPAARQSHAVYAAPFSSALSSRGFF